MQSQIIQESEDLVNQLDLLDSFFKFSSFRYNHTERQLEKVGRWGGFGSGSICHVGPPKYIESLRLLKFVWLSRFSRPLAHLFIYYIVMKLALTGVYHFRYDTLVKQGKDGDNLNHQERCSFDKDIFSGDLVIQDKLKHHRKWLDFLGDPFISLPGLSITIYYFITLTPLFFFAFDYFQKSTKCLSMAHLNFLMDPERERWRMRQKLSQIMRDCIGGSSRSTQEPSVFFNYAKRAGYQRTVYRPSLDSGPEELALERVLYDIENLNLVEPANLSHEWRVKLSKASTVFLCVMATLWASSTMINITICIMIQMYLYARQRLEFIKCSHNMNSTSIYENNLKMLDMREPDRLAYTESDGSTWSGVKLGLMVEPFYYFTTRRLLFIIELYAISIVGCFWGALAMCLSVSSVWHSLKWAGQIEDQLDTCLSQIRHQSLSTTGQEKEDEQLNRLLITCYLHYSLYRREYPTFKTTTSYFVNKFIILLSCYFIIIYFSVIRSDVIFKQLISSFMLCVAMAYNTYLTTFCFLIAKSERIMKRISKLMAIGTASEKYRIPLALWRRLLLDSSQLKDTFALKFFETRVDSKMIVTMNVYLIAILLLFKS